MAQPRVIITQNGPVRISGEEMEWIDESKLHNLIGLIVPPRNIRWSRMPVYITDTLKTIAERWMKMYPTEASSMLADANSLDMSKTSGMSAERLTRRMMAIPDMIYWAMHHIDPDYWQKNNFRAYRDFYYLLPKLCSKSDTGYQIPITKTKIIDSKEMLDDKDRESKVQSGALDDSQRRNSNIGKGIRIRSKICRRDNSKLERFKLRNKKNT